MKSLVTFVLALLLPLTALAGSADSTPCCGTISPAGQKLLQTLNASNVENLWLAHLHVNWETGEADRPGDTEYHEKSTHCSSYAAAMGERLGVYMLRPPAHSAKFLASAQAQWFQSPDGVAQGWHAVAQAQDAQRLANGGELVVVVYQSPNPEKPGHIAVIRPSLKSLASLEQEGPETTQAGKHNHLDWNVRDGFKGHPGAWPEGVRYFAHAVSVAAN